MNVISNGIALRRESIAKKSAAIVLTAALLVTTIGPDFSRAFAGPTEIRVEGGAFSPGWTPVMQQTFDNMQMTRFYGRSIGGIQVGTILSHLGGLQFGSSEGRSVAAPFVAYLESKVGTPQAFRNLDAAQREALLVSAAAAVAAPLRSEAANLSERVENGRVSADESRYVEKRLKELSTTGIYYMEPDQQHRVIAARATVSLAIRQASQESVRRSVAAAALQWGDRGTNGSENGVVPGPRSGKGISASTDKKSKAAKTSSDDQIIPLAQANQQLEEAKAYRGKVIDDYLDWIAGKLVRTTLDVSIRATLIIVGTTLAGLGLIKRMVDGSKSKYGSDEHRGSATAAALQSGDKGSSDGSENGVVPARRSSKAANASSNVYAATTPSDDKIIPLSQANRQLEEAKAYRGQVVGSAIASAFSKMRKAVSGKGLLLAAVGGALLMGQNAYASSLGMAGMAGRPIVGAAIGGAAGFAAGFAITKARVKGGGDFDFSPIIWIGGGLAGAVVGAVVGSVVSAGFAGATHTLMMDGIGGLTGFAAGFAVGKSKVKGGGDFDFSPLFWFGYGLVGAVAGVAVAAVAMSVF